MAKLFKKKNKKPEKKINVGGKPTEYTVELPADIQLSGHAELAAQINSIIRGKQFYILCYITMALKKEVKRRYWNLPSWDSLKAAIVAYFLGDQFYIINII